MDDEQRQVLAEFLGLTDELLDDYLETLGINPEDIEIVGDTILDRIRRAGL